MMSLLAAETIDGDTAVNIATLITVVFGALAVRKWITDVKDAAKDARHTLELRVQALETRANRSGVYEGAKE